MGDGGVDGVLGDVAFGAGVVVAGGVFGERAALCFHFVGGLPGTEHDFAYAAHGLRVAGDHADDAHIVKNVFGGDGLGADAAFCEGHIFGDLRIEMMADHEHVEMFGDGVDGEGARGSGGGRKFVGKAGDADNVGSVAAAGAFGVIGVNGAAGDGRDGGFEEAGFVDGVGVNSDLDVVAIGGFQAGVDGGGSGAPVFVEFQAAGAGFDLLGEGRFGGRVAFAEKTKIHGPSFGGLQHAGQIPGAGRAGGGGGAGSWAGAAADHCRDAVGDGAVNLLWRYEMDVAVDAAGRDD